MTCNISHFLIYCAYLGHKPLGVMFQDKSVCERVCHSNGLTWIECHRKNYVSWSITFTCTLLIACCIHASKWIAKHTENFYKTLSYAKAFFWQWWWIGCKRCDNLKNSSDKLKSGMKWMTALILFPFHFLVNACHLYIIHALLMELCLISKHFNH